MWVENGYIHRLSGRVSLNSLTVNFPKIGKMPVIISKSSLDPTKGGLFILLCLASGVFCRRALKSTRVP